MIFDNRNNYKPFEYGFITDPLIDAIWADPWTPNKFTFISDVQDFKVNLSKQEQELIKKTMLTISQIEIAVKSFWGNIGNLLPQPEIADMGAVFSNIEVVHSRSYSKILDVLGLNKEFEDLLNVKVINDRVKYLSKYNNKIYKNEKKQIVYSLALFTLFTENVSLFSQFYIILGFNHFNNLFKDMSNVVAYTCKEESIHAAGGIKLINQIEREYPEIYDDELKQRIIEESKVALEAEEKIIDWLLGNYENSFLNRDLLVNYVKQRMNNSLKEINIEFSFNTDEKLNEQTFWMEEEIYAPANTDFFYKKPIDYQRNTTSFSEDDLF